MLDVYICDYLMKRKYINSAKIFQREAHVSTDCSAMDVPGGFLFEWWSIFWASYIARYQPQSSNVEEQMHEPMLQQISQQRCLEQMQMQPIVQQQYQQQQKDNIQLQCNTTANDNTARQNLMVTNALARKEILQQKSNENANQLSNATHPILSRSTASEGQIPRQLPYDASLSNLSYFHQAKDPKQHVLTPQNTIGPATCVRLPGADGSLDRVTELNQAARNFPLEGWPLSQQILKNGPCHREHFQSLQSPGQQLDQPNCRSQQPYKVDAAGSNRGCDPVSNTSRDYSKAEENQILRKRKWTISSLDPANSLGTGNAGGMQKSTSMLSINEIGPHGDISTNTHFFCSGSFGPQTSGADQLADNSGSLAHNVESFLSSSNPETKNAIAACSEASQDKTFSEVGIIHANLVNHCDFSYDGKLIATSGNDEKIMLWSVDSREKKCLMKEHSATITDIRFCPRLPRMGTSSLDKTVKIWNANNPRYTLRTFVGHSAPVLSLDFHPKEEDLVCSCDDATEIRYWSIKSGGCAGLSKANATQVRFQCTHGKYLAAAVQNGVSIIDVETSQTYGCRLQGHATNVTSVCWNSSGEYMASLSEDLIRVWKISSGEMQQCVHELSISTKKFQCCLFHPSCPLSLIIGFNQSLDIWHVAENRTITVLEQPISALAVSQYSGLLASVSDENIIKLWK